MKLLKIKLIQETESYYLTKIKYKNIWGKVKTRTCISKKNNISTEFMDTGSDIDVSLWYPIQAFIETGRPEMIFDEVSGDPIDEPDLSKFTQKVIERLS